MAKLENSLLYSYIQMAYEYVHDLGQSQLDGGRQEFLVALYASRFNSILENKEKDTGRPLVLLELASWVKSFYRLYENRLITGILEDLVIEDDAQEAWLASINQYAENFTEDLTQGPVLGFGTDAYATYLPIHFFFDRENPLDSQWGIYISESGVAKIAAVLKNAFEKNGRFGKLEKEEDNHFFLKASYQILLRHELLHFRIESFALNAELALRQPLYVPYLVNAYARDYDTDNCLEEALANAAVLDSVVIRGLFKEMYPTSSPNAWQSIVSHEIFDRQPKGYRNYHLDYSNPVKWEGKYTNRSYASAWNTVNRGRPQQRQLAMNYLCNQILYANEPEIPTPAPFFAFFPDNYFLRAENLVPIHIVKTINPEDSFIRQAPPKMREWGNFMKELNYVATDRGKGDHVVWVSDKFPRLTVDRGKSGEITFATLNSSLSDLGITRHEYERSRETGKLPETLSGRLKQDNKHEPTRK